MINQRYGMRCSSYTGGKRTARAVVSAGRPDVLMGVAIDQHGGTVGDNFHHGQSCGLLAIRRLYCLGLASGLGITGQRRIGNGRLAVNPIKTG